MESLKGFNGLDIKMEAPDLHDQLSYPYKEDIISRFDTADDLGIPSTEMFAHNSLFMNEDDEPEVAADDDDDDVIILHIDIREPIEQLRTLLEQRIGIHLSRYEFWLQDAQALEPHKNLVDQCVKGEGLVQINAQVRTNSRRINIVDVLKPTDDALAEISQMMKKAPHLVETDEASDSESHLPDAATEAAGAAIEKELNTTTMFVNPNEDSSMENDNQATNMVPARKQSVEVMDEDDDDSNSGPAEPAKPQWIIDSQFRKDQTRLKISDDPREWTIAQVKHWLQWAVRQFNLTQIKLQDWCISGKELYELTIEQFHQKVPQDPENIFWTHLELLRRLKVAAVQGEVHETEEYADYNSGSDVPVNNKNRAIIGIKSTIKSMKPLSKPCKPFTVFVPANDEASLGMIPSFGVEAAQQGNRTGNNGQIQLWQFLLEILTDREHKDIISWLGGQGEFKLTDPERVAQLWGERKNKPTMNYEKLSRALRYYYDGDMISKVHGKRFVYKFVCDLTQLIGYNAQELSNLVNENVDTKSNNFKDFID